MVVPIISRNVILREVRCMNTVDAIEGMFLYLELRVHWIAHLLWWHDFEGTQNKCYTCEWPERKEA